MSPFARPPAQRPLVRVEGLTVGYGTTTALDDVSFELDRGCSVAVLGPNGSGKSTLFGALVGLVSCARGSVEVAAERIAYLPQHLNLEPSFPLTVADVADMGRWGRRGWLRRSDAADRQAAERAMELLGVADLANRRLHELSGGQRQRALLAQIAAQDAELLLLDEPASGVDRPTERALRALIASWRDEGRTVMVATHDLEAAARNYDVVLALNGRLVAHGPPARVCVEPVLRETFSGHVARLGDDLVDTSHHHHEAG
ncbi:MAG: zinc ABC transporter ATP-binding protein AztA [Solirubrobacterales bacterium]